MRGDIGRQGLLSACTARPTPPAKPALSGVRDWAKMRLRQNNRKAPALTKNVGRLCGTELTPLGEGGGAVQLEIFAAVEMALLIEMIVYG